MARPEGFEPPTYGFEARRSIHLSYGRALGILHVGDVRPRAAQSRGEHSSNSIHRFPRYDRGAVIESPRVRRPGHPREGGGLPAGRSARRGAGRHPGARGRSGPGPRSDTCSSRQRGSFAAVPPTVSRLPRASMLGGLPPYFSPCLRLIPPMQEVSDGCNAEPKSTSVLDESRPTVPRRNERPGPERGRCLCQGCRRPHHHPHFALYVCLVFAAFENMDVESGIQYWRGQKGRDVVSNERPPCWRDRARREQPPLGLRQMDGTS